MSGLAALMIDRLAPDGRRGRPLPGPVLLLLLVLSPVSAGATDVSLSVGSGLTALAEFEDGPKRQPAVLLIHGFLDSSADHPIPALRSGLAAQGFAVLAPTLSLGIERRRQRLACGALQLHRLDQSLRELALWVDWLLARGFDRVVLVGYGGGLYPLLAYLADRPSARVSALFALDPPDPDQPAGAEAMASQRRLARAAMRDGDTRIGRYRFEACASYRAPAAAFLSYARWSQAAVLEQLRSLPIAVRVLTGSAPEPAWLQSMAAQGIDVQSLPATRYLRAPDQLDTVVQLVAGMLRATQ